MLRKLVGLAISVCFAGVIIYGHLFGWVVKGMVALAGGPDESAKPTLYVVDERRQEVSFGDNPLPGLHALGKYWSERKPARRIIVMGNSQTFSVVLSPTEKDPGVPMATYVDIVGRRVEARENSAVYRLSAPNLSYSEALWYLVYLTSVSEVRPTELVLQLNYESFRKGGIRDGMLGLLGEPRFREEVERLSALAERDETLATALRRFQQSQASGGAAREGQPSRSPTFGEEAEHRVRGAIEEGFGHEKHIAKGDFATILYLARVYLLRITPLTPRPLSGAAYQASLNALERVATLCASSGVSLRLFLAPRNPVAQLWATPADRDRYLGAARNISKQFGLPLVDLENSVPREQWGAWLEGPDPIHFGLEGHKTMAAAVLAKGLVP